MLIFFWRQHRFTPSRSVASFRQGAANPFGLERAITSRELNVSGIVETLISIFSEDGGRGRESSQRISRDRRVVGRGLSDAEALLDGVESA